MLWESMESEFLRLFMLSEQLPHHRDLSSDVVSDFRTLGFVLSVVKVRTKFVKPFNCLLKAAGTKLEKGKSLSRIGRHRFISSRF
jgi:hypothetical protein